MNCYAESINGKLLKVVTIQKTNPQTKKVTQSIIFTEDIHLPTLKIIQYYSLRLQIEFDFKDTKKFFELAHFKNYKKKQLTTSVNIAFTIKLVAQVLSEKYKKELNTVLTTKV